MAIQQNLADLRWLAVYGARAEAARNALGLDGGIRDEDLQEALISLLVDAKHLADKMELELDLVALAEEALRIHEGEERPEPSGGHR